MVCTCEQQAVTTTLLERRAALEDTAQVASAALGRCVYCGSDRLYLQQSHPWNKAIRTVHGALELGRQSIRCHPRKPAAGLFPLPGQARTWSLP